MVRNLREYLAQKKILKEQEFIPRLNCSVCGFSKKTCYCHLIKKFDAKITFAILIHKLEVERKIATGTLSHLILKDSYLIPGHDYTECVIVNHLINDPTNHCVVMYPGEKSVNLSSLTIFQKKRIVPSGKKLVIFVIDGTWRTARQTMRLSSNLKKLARLTFDYDKPSNFIVRKQPSREYLSTAEAIHRTLDLLGNSLGYDSESRLHDNLIEVFNFIVAKQILRKKENNDQ